MKKHIWDKDSIDFWLAVYVGLSAFVGWLMVHFQIVR
jgi:hypothetical protein